MVLDPVFKHPVGHLTAIYELLNQNSIVLLTSLGNCRCELLGAFNLGNPKAAPATVGLYKQGQPQFGYYIKCIVNIGVAQEYLTRHLHTGIPKETLACIFIEREQRNRGRRGCKGHPHHLEIGLQKTIFAGSPVYHHKCLPKPDTCASYPRLGRNHKGKIRLVNRVTLRIPVRPRNHPPLCTTHHNLPHIVPFAVYMLCHMSTTLERNLILRRVPSIYQGYVFFHVTFRF
ncbi:hypothetical protein SDC9_155497 [bioreactor metagenome]|uniref:Uncharacterized protein n=1 Tax=bioreactor metagenome TaxID=1076179 RepID=A0A645F1M9_9ZZZZ